VAAGEPGGGGRDTDGGKSGNTGGGKGGGTGGGTKESIGGRINKGPLFRGKKGFIIFFFLGRPRFRPFSPRLRGAILPVKIIGLKKKLIKNKTKIYGNTKRVRPGYADKIKCQNNI